MNTPAWYRWRDPWRVENKKMFIYYISCSKTVPYLTHSIFKRITSVRSHHTTHSKLYFYWPMTQTINLICLLSDTVYLRFDEQSASVCRLPWNNKSENIEYAYDCFFLFLSVWTHSCFLRFFFLSLSTLWFWLFSFFFLYFQSMCGKLQYIEEVWRLRKISLARIIFV